MNAIETSQSLEPLRTRRRVLSAHILCANGAADSCEKELAEIKQIDEMLDAFDRLDSKILSKKTKKPVAK